LVLFFLFAIVALRAAIDRVGCKLLRVREVCKTGGFGTENDKRMVQDLESGDEVEDRPTSGRQLHLSQRFADSRSVELSVRGFLQCSRYMYSKVVHGGRSKIDACERYSSKEEELKLS